MGISMTLTDTIAIPELVWTVIAFVAVIYVFRVFKRAVLNLSYLKKMGWNHGREDVAIISIITYGTLLFIQVMNMFVGILSMVIPSIKTNTVHPLTYVIVTIFILKSCVVAVSAFFIDRRQVVLIRKIQILEENDG